MIFVITEGLKNIGRAKLASAMVSLLIGTALLVGGWFFLKIELEPVQGSVKPSDVLSPVTVRFVF